MQPRTPKGRKLVTYGRSTRDQICGNDSSSISSFSAIFNEGGESDVSSRLNSVTNTEEQQQLNKNRDLRSPITQLSGVEGSKKNTDENIYDLPSSDGMEDHGKGKKKRRKLVSDPQNQPTQKPTVRNVRGNSQLDVSAGSHETSNTRPRPRVSSRNPSQTRHRGREPSTAHGTKCDIPKSAQIELHSGSAMQRSCIPNISLGGNDHPERNRGGSETSRLQSLPEINREYEGTVPSRRRLIDSLDATKKSVKKPSTISDSDNEANSAQISFSSAVKGNNMSYVQPRQILSSTTLHNTSNNQESTTAIPVDSRRSKVTYARQRSFMGDLQISGELKGQDRLLFSMDQNHPIQRQPTTEIMPRTFLHINDDENNDSGPVRSIHELRQAGDDARFRGAVDSMFEDIEDPCNPGAGKCNSLVQLCIKLLDSQFARRFSEHGFETRLVEHVTSSLDIVSTSFALCGYLLIFAGRSIPSRILDSFWPRLLVIAPKLLGIKDDILPLVKRQFGSSKFVQKSVQNSIPQLSSAIFSPPQSSKISPCFLALRCIQLTLSNFRKGDRIEPVSSIILDQLVQLLIVESSAEAANFLLSPEDFHILALAFSILESYTVLSGTLAYGYRDSFKPLSRLSNFLDMSWYGFNDRGRPILALYIRVILNITNNDSSLCSEFSTPGIVEGLVNIITTETQDESEDFLAEENNSLNTVILALGALINLAEKSESSRAVFLNPVSPTFLQLLLRQFFAGINTVPKAHSVLEVHHNVAIGYLSTLLVTLCLNDEARSQVMGSSHGEGLAIVLSTADEFLHYHQKVEQDHHPFETSCDKMTGFTTRLKDIICQVKELASF
ncbi:hypothetical protein ASPWEDRAFT_23392 [Aspergillus wentii DTO 134E9]|uniref:Wings apart-like protein C-terminal domain-containing protein n=1 Tax=Aspergillus wentii DTO 134E9 TaxID=1073089 RepID=A0A1L9S2B1_ASPWE|nr:uncharacterized protein ASPWEDRAFT_23392 [Aspergillus wentii DTO 134E9]OJJ41285.1 hypothetical protein ASPWEDRAFT_23392 [Aspergillus wentii DTO 134E9]